jgi:hypothetical protein
MDETDKTRDNDRYIAATVVAALAAFCEIANDCSDVDTKDKGSNYHIISYINANSNK